MEKEREKISPFSFPKRLDVQRLIMDIDKLEYMRYTTYIRTRKETKKMDFKEIGKKDFKEMTAGQRLGTKIAPVALWFISAAFIWWGWNIFAWHFNLPQFGYMEVFAMRMALACIMRIFWQRTEKRG